MKKIRIIIFILISQACVTEKSNERTYRLENGTIHKIKIDFYQYKEHKKSIHLNENGGTWDAHDEHFRGTAPSGAFHADSVVIFYDSLKFKSHSFKTYPQTRNILVEESYTPINNELSKFTFTEEDYLKADSIK